MTTENARQTLAHTLRDIEAADQDYDRRYRLVWGAMYAALRAGYNAGVRIDPTDPEWPVVYIDLPTGQVSWHMPQYASTWDGHSTDEKYTRCREFAHQAHQVQS